MFRHIRLYLYADRKKPVEKEKMNEARESL